MKFKKGDRVKCIKEVDGNTLIIGVLGTVAETPYNNYPFLVQFDENINGHNGEGGNHGGYHWFCRPDSLKLVFSEKITKVIPIYGVAKFLATIERR